MLDEIVKLYGSEMILSHTARNIPSKLFNRMRGKLFVTFVTLFLPWWQLAFMDSTLQG